MHHITPTKTYPTNVKLIHKLNHLLNESGKYTKHSQKQHLCYKQSQKRKTMAKGDAERWLDPIREEDENEGKYANERKIVFGGEESESGGEREKFECGNVSLFEWHICYM